MQLYNGQFSLYTLIKPIQITIGNIESPGLVAVGVASLVVDNPLLSHSRGVMSCIDNPLHGHISYWMSEIKGIKEI